MNASCKILKLFFIIYSIEKLTKYDLYKHNQPGKLSLNLLLKKKKINILQ